MRAFNSHSSLARLVARATGFAAALFAAASFAAAPGITGPTFNLVAAEGRISQPDGAAIYAWGYGCKAAPAGFLPAAIGSAACPLGQMQLPGPTLIVTEGQTVTVNLTNNLPAAAGRTSILFPGFDVTTAGGAPGLRTAEANTGGTVSYTFPTAGKAGTHSYFSGTQGDLQVEMGLFGALIVLPSTIPANCGTSAARTPVYQAAYGEKRGAPTAPDDFRLAAAAFNHPAACYDREYLFQFSEIDPRIHTAAQQQANTVCNVPTGCMVIDTEPYHAVYFLINGRSAPDTGDPNYSAQYPLQPYNGNPHMHPGEMVLVRIIGQGRMQHPFHEHANHVRVLARDGNMLLGKPRSDGSTPLAGPLLFTTTTTPGQTIDALFQWTAKGLNWDVYSHTSDVKTAAGGGACTPDANGYHNVPADDNFYEWCADHKKALESKPFGTVAANGPVTLPDPNILANGAWYSGSPYFGPDATARAVGPTPIPPFGTIANDPGSEAGYAYMWHSHNEREITTNNIFPGGMMMMMLVDPWVFLINEAN